MLAGMERAQKCVIILGSYISNDATASAWKTDNHYHTITVQIQSKPLKILNFVNPRKISSLRIMRLKVSVVINVLCSL